MNTPKRLAYRIIHISQVQAECALQKCGGGVTFDILQQRCVFSPVQNHIGIGLPLGTQTKRSAYLMCHNHKQADLSMFTYTIEGQATDVRNILGRCL